MFEFFIDRFDQSFTFIFVVILLCTSCVEPEELPTIISDDSLFHEQWYLNNTNDNADIQVHGLTYTGRGVLISLIDDGLDIFHEGLILNVGDRNYSYLAENFIFLEGKHGTACAGIIAGEQGNGIGIVSLT